MSVRYCDGKTVSLVAGSDCLSGHDDGVGEWARFDGVKGLVCTRDRKQLWCSDHNNHILRSIDLEQRRVKREAGCCVGATFDGPGLEAEFYLPGQIAFDLTPSLAAEPESALWIVREHLRRFDIKTGTVSTVRIPGLKLASSPSLSCIRRYSDHLKS